MSGHLDGASVLVAGAGLAGLAAARDLAAMGAAVTVVEARTRAGGRVWTMREGFGESQHAEAGGDMIDEAQSAIRQLIAELGLRLTRILRDGFGYARTDARGQTRMVHRSVAGGWNLLARTLEPLVERYRLAEKRWDSPISAAFARRSVSDWLHETKADDDLRAITTGLRGFFLADPEELSLLALVDQFASDNDAPWRMYRIDGGNDRLTDALARPLKERVQLDTELVAISHRGGHIRASVKNGRRLSQIHADYALLALPATLLCRIPITPALPAGQHEAFASLKYGRATKTLLQFSRRLWRAPGRPKAFGSALPFGALWDGNEEQRGSSGILTLLAGGSASTATRAIVEREGIGGLVRQLGWLGLDETRLGTWRQIDWMDEKWSKGGYAFFDPSFDPSLREWLARPCGRLFFAGEHTNNAWQGYMNGAVESGRRAAAEIVASHVNR